MGSPDELRKFIDSLDPNEVKALLYDWETWARPNQLIPTGEWWTHWLILAGRGYGKTRTGAETVNAWAKSGKYGRIALVAEDAGDARDVMIEGESGIMACSPPWFRPVYEPTKRRLTWPNGAVATVFADSDPEALRGPQHDAAWLDELAKWTYARDTWSNLMFGLRLGKQPRTIITTTPRPIPLVRDLVAREGKDVIITRGTTYENRANLAESFFTEIITEYEGTTLGRQELYAELIDPEESGIIKRSWFKLWPNDRALPRFKIIVQSYDTAFTDKTENDATACTVWGVFEEPNNPGVFSVMLLDAWSDRLQYPDLRERVKKEYQAVYGDHEARTDYVLIEEKGSGISLIQDMRMARVPVQTYNPGRADKTQRLNAVSHLFSNGRVYLLESNKGGGKPVSWSNDMLAQLCAFPLVEHDDYVDSTTQALQLLRDQQWLVVDLFSDDEFIDYHARRKARINPYDA